MLRPVSFTLTLVLKANRSRRCLSSGRIYTSSFSMEFSWLVRCLGWTCAVSRESSRNYAGRASCLPRRWRYLRNGLLLLYGTSHNWTRTGSRDGAVWIVHGLVTYHHTSIGRTVVGNGRASILGNHVNIKIHQPLSRDIRGCCAHTVGSVAYRATEARVDMALMLGEGGVCHDIAQIVAFAAHRVRPANAEIGVGIKIRDQLARPGCLAGNVLPFQDVGPL